MDLFRRFQPILLRSTLIATYKTFVRGQLGYADSIYDQAYNFSFHENLSSIMLVWQ